MRFRHMSDSLTESASILISAPDGSLFTIVNTVKGSVLVPKATLAAGFFTRLRGLAFTKTLGPDSGMIFPLCSSIHTCGMRFPLDVVFIDVSFRVLRVIENLAPWRFSPLVRGSFCAVEVSSGAARKSCTEIGDEVAFERLV